MSRTPPSRRINLIRALAPTGMRGPECDHSRAAAAHIADWISVPTGVSTLHDRFAATVDPQARFAAMAAHFEEHLGRFAPYRAAHRAEMTKNLQIIGVSGTATTFGAIHLGLRSYERARVDGLWMPVSGVAEIIARLLSTRIDRIAHPGIGPGRAELVLSGAAILSTILRTWTVSRLRIADRGLREGMLYGLLHQRRIAAQ
jgi:exopolyphosphatase/guanosine-5'-triphosphate,3'-diphosphate pyrophosphatase